MKIIFHRKDNIGDLVLSIPTVIAAKRHWPSSNISFYGSDYVEQIFSSLEIDVDFIPYTKSKHELKLSRRLYTIFRQAKTLLKLRGEKYDLFFYLGNGEGYYGKQLKWLVNPKYFISFCHSVEFAERHSNSSTLFICSPTQSREAEFKEISRILGPFNVADLNFKVPVLVVDESHKLSLRRKLGLRSSRVIGVHLSARRAKQRWPIEKFGTLIELLCKNFSDFDIIVTWAPGSSHNQRHPGDDERCERLRMLLGPISGVYFSSTLNLNQLLHSQSLCQTIFCSDGGAMHTGAALGVKLVAIFGDSDPKRWHPIGDGHSVILSSDGDVGSISVSEVYDAMSSTLTNARCQ